MLPLLTPKHVKCDKRDSYPSGTGGKGCWYNKIKNYTIIMKKTKNLQLTRLQHIISTERKKDPKWYLTFTKSNNAYFGYISEILKARGSKPQTELNVNNGSFGNVPSPIGAETQQHHIIPKFLFNHTNKEEIAYMNSNENTILLTAEEHLKAHEIFSELYDDPRAKGAVLLLKGQMTSAKTEWRKAGAYASHAIQKANGTGRWDSALQKERAAIAMAKPDALEVRSKAGKVGGRNRNLDRVIKPTDKFIFSYNDKQVFCVLNCSTGGDVLKSLKHYNPSTQISRVSNLLNGKRRIDRGWTCNKIN
jgi:hypothetical protein